MPVDKSKIKSITILLAVLPAGLFLGFPAHETGAAAYPALGDLDAKINSYENLDKKIDNLQNEIFDLRWETSATDSLINQKERQLKGLKDAEKLEKKNNQVQKKENRLKIKRLENRIESLERQINLRQKQIDTMQKTKELRQELEALNQEYISRINQLPENKNSASSIAASPDAKQEANNKTGKENNSASADKPSHKKQEEPINEPGGELLQNPQDYQALSINQGSLEENLEFIIFLLRNGFESSGELNYSVLSEIDAEKQIPDFLLISYQNKTLAGAGANILATVLEADKIKNSPIKEFPGLKIISIKKLFMNNES